MTTVVMPQLGESVMEGTVVRWIARPGQKVERDEPLVEIATDKANTEIPSPSAGVLVEQLAKEGAVVTVGGALARLDEAGAAAAAAAPQAKPAPKAASPAAPSGAATAEADADANGVRATPVGRNVAQEHGLDLSKVPGSGAGGRVMKADVTSFLEKGATSSQQSEMQPPSSTFPGQKAPTMPPNAYSQPPVAPPWSMPPPPSFGPGVAGAAPVNLGVEVETDKGLLVPVIRRANELSVLGLARALDDLAARGRNGKVTADELSGGSFTVSNPGLKGNLFGAAIINQPQVGIVRMGEIVKRAVVRERDGEDAIVIRSMMYLTLSYDHRVIDGVTGNGFLHRVRELIEEAKFEL